MTDFLADVADAIREKKGTTEPINPQDFSAEIASIKSGGNGWTGHADAEGLRAIGWTDEDIAYYQENGVDWDEADDHLHLVSEDNKALYGVLTADNISLYKDRIVYLPKIDISNRTSANNLFKDCYYLVAIPSLDFSNVTFLSSTFENCVSLKSVAPLNIPKVIQLYRAFYQCSSLRKVKLDINASMEAAYVFYKCSSLESIISDGVLRLKATSNTFSFCGNLREIPQLDTSALTGVNYMFYYCSALPTIQLLDVSSSPTLNNTFNDCCNLSNVYIRGLKASCNCNNAYKWSKESLLYAINNEAATSPITIMLATNVYNKYATDPDVVEALANHPNITLAK
ncbi:MAG: leucine-rich repeat protein [Alistipes sp.]|nr:leucine-rich repeat protein [Alistipes sp.]